ncbi:Testis-expressed protein 11, partial [Geodia barretti]
MLCYNLGLDLYQKTSYQHSVTLLKESYEIGRGCPTVGAVKQARTLRLMANAYLEWDGQTYWQKALNAVGLANSEHSHPAGLLLKTNILLQHNERRAIWQTGGDTARDTATPRHHGYHGTGHGASVH